MKNLLQFISVTVAVGLVQRPVDGQLASVLASSQNSQTAGGSSFFAALSADAHFVVFLSHANNLVTNDSMNPWLDVFLRDLTNGVTALISVDASGTGGGNDNSSAPAVSTNGAWVTFESAARNLVANDTNGFSDVFLRDVASGVTRLVSVTPAGTAANSASGNPLLSQDGQLVVYESKASNLVDGDANGAQDIFIYDVVQQSNRLVSTMLTFPDPNFSQNGPSHSPAMTPDGRLIAYVKSATNNLLNPTAVSHAEVYVRDTLAATTYRLSTGISSNFTGGSAYACYNPTVSADGSSAVFKANTNGPAAALYRRKQFTTLGVQAELIAVNATTQGWAQVSADGRFVAYEATDGIRVWDGQTTSNRLVMANVVGVGGSVCSQPAISADGNRIVFLVASNGFSAIYTHDWANDGTVLAVVNSGGQPASVNDSAAPLLSENGQTIVFDSLDASLVGDDSNRAYDVFAFALGNGLTTLVTARAATLSSVTPPTASQRVPNSISANGRFVAVASADLFAADTNRFQDVYVRDLATAARHYLGTPTNGTRDPILSADGRYVAYLSAGPESNWRTWGLPYYETVFRRDLLTGAEILVDAPTIRETPLLYEHRPVAISPDGNRVAYVARRFNIPLAQIWVRDIDAGTTNLVSVSFNGLNEGNGASSEPMFSPDGRWLIFRSAANNLTTNNSPGLFARDVARQRTVLLNPQYAPPAFSQRVSISGDSRFVASVSALSTVPISLFDLQTETRTAVPVPLYARSVSLSGNGRWLAWENYGGPALGIYVTDLTRQTNELISTQLGTTMPVTRPSDHPLISHDGRYVVFASDATNLVVGDLNNVKDIFVRDRLRGVTLLASINRAGTGSGNGASVMPVLAADGRTLLFQSFASDLIEGDFNETADVFVLRLGGTDSDNDQMDDDWEMAYFNTLARDGSGDFDLDGSTDAVEYQLGTDPTNAGSVFQVLKLTREGGPATKLIWNSAPGRTYRVQFKDDLSAAEWSEASQTVTAAGTTAVWIDRTISVPAGRFYRVFLVP